MPFVANTSFASPIEGPLTNGLSGPRGAGTILPAERVQGLWTFTSEKRKSENTPPIQMLVNAENVKWAMAKRKVKNDVLNGSVFTHFLNSQDQNNDLLKLDFKFNSGNIDLRGSASSGAFEDAAPFSVGDTGALAKLQTFHEMYALSREAVVFQRQTKNRVGTNFTVGGTNTETPVYGTQRVANEWIIHYISPAFPSQIIIVGLFDNVADFEEVADNNNSIDFTFSFWVTDTFPSLDDFRSVLYANSATALRRPRTAV